MVGQGVGQGVGPTPCPPPCPTPCPTPSHTPPPPIPHLLPHLLPHCWGPTGCSTASQLNIFRTGGPNRELATCHVHSDELCCNRSSISCVTTKLVGTALLQQSSSDQTTLSNAATRRVVPPQQVTLLVSYDKLCYGVTRIASYQSTITACADVIPRPPGQRLQNVQVYSSL